MITDPEPPVADDDFPEFAEPPQYKPPVIGEDRKRAEDAKAEQAQVKADEVIARLRRQREQEEH